MNLATGWLYVRPENQKNRRGKKFRVGQDAIAAIGEIVELRRELLFDWPYRREALSRHFRKLQTAAGLPESPLSNGRFHKMRRTSATMAMVHSGMPAAIALLDHSGPEVTKRYLDPSKMPGTDATAFLPSLEPESEVPK